MAETARAVVVIGGGPAGLAFALGACHSGFQVTVLDRGKPPIDKACGEGLMPDGVAALEALGLPRERIPGRPFRGIRYLDGEIVAEASFRGEPALGIRRSCLHQVLVTAAEEAGVELGWGAKVTGLYSTSDGWRVESEESRWIPRWVVGADGLHSRVRRWAGLEGPEASARHRRFGVRRHFAIEPWCNHVEVYWADGREAYVTPVGEKEVGVGMLWSGPLQDPTRGPGRGQPRSFDALLEAFPALAARLSGATATSRDRGAGGLEQRVRGVARGNLALLGDAAGYLDAITGEGLSLAFHQAVALVEALEKEDLGLYRGACRRLRRVPDAITRLLLFAERRPWLRRRLIRAFAADPKLFADLLALHAREASARDFGACGLARMIAGLASSGSPLETRRGVAGASGM